jgi:hypothetical protein
VTGGWSPARLAGDQDRRLADTTLKRLDAANWLDPDPVHRPKLAGAALGAG